MRRFAVLALLGVLSVLSPRGVSKAEMPYPPPPTGVDPNDYAAYMFLPSGAPLPNDFAGDDNNWKLTSETTGNPLLDTSRQELFGVKGTSVDLALRRTTGRPDVVIGITDSGIKWQDSNADFKRKFYLNRGELPLPENSTEYDKNHNGVFNLEDYDGDSRVTDANGNGVRDPEDLIRRFSDGVDDDHDGYVDNISGWDFFQHDNDAFDEVDFGHGTGGMRGSGSEANNGAGQMGTCPNCLILPLRVGDSFVAQASAFAEAVIFAVDTAHAQVIQDALGTLNGGSFAQQAIDYAWTRGTIVVASAADEEAAHHNLPSNYNHTLVVNSVMSANESVGAPVYNPGSYLQMNGCTNFGAHTILSVTSTRCSSEATSKGAGQVALVFAAAKNAVDRGVITTYHRDDGSYAPFAISANEAKQILTWLADDIDFETGLLPPDSPMNYAYLTPPGSRRYPSGPFWDPWFGYGRLNTADAVSLAHFGVVPPEAELNDPLWFETLDPAAGFRQIVGRVAANRATSFTYEIEYAIGVQPKPADWKLVYASPNLTSPVNGVLATLDLSQVAADKQLHIPDPRTLIYDDYARQDLDAITIRVRVWDSNSRMAEDLKSLFLRHDDQLVAGFPKFLGGLSASPRLADLDDDNFDEIILATDDGVVHALNPDGSEVPGWPVTSDPTPGNPDSAAFVSGAVPYPRTAILATPAVGDLDGNGTLEVIAADVEGRLYVWNRDGSRRAGFPVAVDPRFSPVTSASGQHLRNQLNRVHRGFLGSPALGDLDHDGKLEIVIGAYDSHVYAWNDDGTPVRGWPVFLMDPAKVTSVDPVSHLVTRTPDALSGTKIISTPAIADLDGDGWLEVVIGKNEEYAETPNSSAVENFVTTFASASGGAVIESGNGRAYAIYHDGEAHDGVLGEALDPQAFLPGWPVKVGLIQPGLLSIVASGVADSPVVADLDGDGKLEVGLHAHAGPAYVFNVNGVSVLGRDPLGRDIALASDLPGAGAPFTDMPATPGLGFSAFANLGGGISYLTPVVGVGRLVDVVLPEQNEPSEDGLGAWNPRTGQFLPAWPQLMNDLQFLTGPAVADITGDGLPEVISGSATYDLRAMNAAGVPALGWPKNTGGWTVPTPAVGHFVPNDRRQVIGATREGWLFAWLTPALTCSAGSEWPTFHHDAWSTGQYGVDTVRPGKIKNLQLLAGGGLGPNLVRFTAPGDDVNCGTATRYEVRFSSNPITPENFLQGTKVSGIPAPNSAEVPETLYIAGWHGTRYVAIQAIDERGNRGAISNVIQLTLP